MKHANVVKIVAADFDGTIVNTFEKSPNGMEITTAYRYAVGDIFGSQELFDYIGGLKNRAPAEVVTEILKLDRSLGTKAHEYYLRHSAHLSSLVPEGKGCLNSIHPGLVDELTETLVRVKLSYLIDEVSSAWPKVYDGALDAFEEFERIGYRMAIITSGHDVFLQKVFRTWGARCPQFTVTDDDMRALDLPPEMKCKPHKMLWEVLGNRIRTRTGFGSSFGMYFGDCPVKDRGLAWNGNVRFGWFNPEKKEVPNGFGRNEFQFHSWHDAHNMLR